MQCFVVSDVGSIIDAKAVRSAATNTMGETTTAVVGGGVCGGTSSGSQTREGYVVRPTYRTTALYSQDQQQRSVDYHSLQQLQRQNNNSQRQLQPHFDLGSSASAGGGALDVSTSVGVLTPKTKGIATTLGHGHGRQHIRLPHHDDYSDSSPQQQQTGEDALGNLPTVDSNIFSSSGSLLQRGKGGDGASSAPSSTPAGFLAHGRSPPSGAMMMSGEISAGAGLRDGASSSSSDTASSSNSPNKGGSVRSASLFPAPPTASKAAPTPAATSPGFRRGKDSKNTPNRGGGHSNTYEEGFGLIKPGERVRGVGGANGGMNCLLAEAVIDHMNLLPFGFHRPSKLFSEVGRHTNLGMMLRVRDDSRFVLRKPPRPQQQAMLQVPEKHKNKPKVVSATTVRIGVGASSASSSHPSSILVKSTNDEKSSNVKDSHHDEKGGDGAEDGSDGEDTVVATLGELQLLPMLTAKEPVPPVTVGTVVLVRRRGDQRGDTAETIAEGTACILATARQLATQQHMSALAAAHGADRTQRSAATATAGAAGAATGGAQAPPLPMVFVDNSSFGNGSFGLPGNTSVFSATVDSSNNRPVAGVVSYGGCGGGGGGVVPPPVHLNMTESSNSGLGGGGGSPRPPFPPRGFGTTSTASGTAGGGEDRNGAWRPKQIDVAATQAETTTSPTHFEKGLLAEPGSAFSKLSRPAVSPAHAKQTANIAATTADRPGSVSLTGSSVAGHHTAVHRRPSNALHSIAATNSMHLPSFSSSSVMMSPQQLQHQPQLSADFSATGSVSGNFSGTLGDMSQQASLAGTGGGSGVMLSDAAVRAMIPLPKEYFTSSSVATGKRLSAAAVADGATSAAHLQAVGGSPTEIGRKSSALSFFRPMCAVEVQARETLGTASSGATCGLSRGIVTHVKYDCTYTVRYDRDLEIESGVLHGDVYPIVPTSTNDDKTISNLGEEPGDHGPSEKPATGVSPSKAGMSAKQLRAHQSTLSPTSQVHAAAKRRQTASDRATDGVTLKADPFQVDKEFVTVRDRIVASLETQVRCLVIECLGSQKYRVIPEHCKRRVITIDAAAIVHVTPLLWDALTSEPCVRAAFEGLDVAGNGFVSWDVVSQFFIANMGVDGFGVPLSQENLSKALLEMCVRGRRVPLRNLLSKTMIVDQGLPISFPEFEYLWHRLTNAL